MGLILDTSVLVATERKRFDLDALLQSLEPGEPAATSAICVSELLHGLERSKRPELRAPREAFIERVLEELVVHPFGLEDARIHAVVGARLVEAGLRIGDHDLLVAATCLRLDYRLATLNVAEFSRVPGLALVGTAAFAR